MDCKTALLENGEDLDKATDWLREKGLAKAAKKADRIAAEGLALTKTCASCGKTVIIEVNCETDFVAKGDDFHSLVDNVAGIILKNDCKDVEEAKKLSESLFADATVKMGEKFDLRRFTILNKEEGTVIGSYIHMGGKIAVVVKLNGGNDELAKQIAMHVAANNPAYISMANVPADVIEHERKVQVESAKQDPKLAGKPEAVLNKILEGKINKYFSEQCLLNQAFLMDDSKTVEQVLKEAGASIVSFVRYAVGEGIEKRVDDFANEVMKEVNK
jgi:elongation factor Ts